jgi:citrate/tricarballylate utilization protein
MHGTRILDEADRLMTVCNSCRYCEGLCAVFPAMEMRRAFSDGDLNYLANLCHGCGACYVDCQFSPPHEFNVNVPQTLAIARAESYAAYAWPVPSRVTVSSSASSPRSAWPPSSSASLP